MALSGVHIACVSVNTANGASLLGKLQWSQTMASPGTTSQVAPSGERAMIFEVSASTADVFVAYGQTPDATAGSRVLVRLGQDRTFLAFPGDKLAWVAA